MIHFFAAYPRTMVNFINSWAPELAEKIQTFPYRKVWLRKSFQHGACIFSDLELLSSWRLCLAQRFSDRLRQIPEGRKILNSPRNYSGRFQLSQILYEKRINHFRVWRLTEPNDRLKFPVFLRREADHRGSLSGLLRSRDELEDALKKLSFRDRWLRHRQLMAVEYIDCADADGIFRKFSVMNIGGVLIPRHILFSRNWLTKKPDLMTAAMADEEAAFIENFPHREQIAEIFRIAGVDYGRIDYGLNNERVQVWEINTNPTIVPKKETINQLRLASQIKSAKQIAQTLQILAQG